MAFQSHCIIVLKLVSIKPFMIYIIHRIMLIFRLVIFVRQDTIDKKRHKGNFIVRILIQEL